MSPKQGKWKVCGGVLLNCKTITAQLVAEAAKETVLFRLKEKTSDHKEFTIYRRVVGQRFTKRYKTF